MAVANVASLTEAQWELVRAIRGEYIAASLCTDPADRPAAEAALSRMYELAGRDAPQFIWCQSPAAVRLMIRMLDPCSADRRALNVGEISEVRGWPPDELEDRLSHSLSCALALGRELERELRLLLGGWPQIPRQLFAAARDDVMSRPLADLLGEPLGEAAQKSLQGIGWPPPQVRSHWYHGLPGNYLGHGWWRSGGQFHSWMAEFDVLRRLGLVRYYDQDGECLDLLGTLIRSCGWWEPYERVCVVTEHPATVRAEVSGALAQLRLHCEDGPAITFRDGWSVHAWHGTRVPATLIEHGWDIAAITAEPSGAVRRCAIEKLGWNESSRI